MVKGVFVSFWAFLDLAVFLDFLFNIVETFGKLHTQLEKTSGN